jgi:FXSXX-COOH protein
MSDDTKAIETDLPDLVGISLADLTAVLTADQTADQTAFGHAVRRILWCAENPDDPIAAFNNSP